MKALTEMGGDALFIVQFVTHNFTSEGVVGMDLARLEGEAPNAK